jgi:thermitase
MVRFELNVRPVRLVAGLAASAAMSLAAAQSSVATDAQGDYVRGRVLVQARAGVGAADVARVVGAQGGTRARAIGSTGLYVIELPPQASEHALAERLARSPHFKFAELDRRFRAAFTPNDTYYANQWHTAKLNAPAAWDVAQGDGVVIAILDSGVDAAHPDLAAQMVAGRNVIGNNADTADVQGHGTAVAGAAAATLNNGAGFAAIAGRAKIMPIRIANADLWADASVVAAAITWAADHGARIASISYSGMAGNATVLAAADYMRAKGGLVVVAAGNAGGEEAFAATTKLIPVSATDRNDALSAWSSWGSYVAVAAPGLDIACTMRGGAYGWCWGTSMSAPLVAGTLALMMAARPTLANTQIESLLYSTAVDLGGAGRDKLFGHGRIDANAAVRAAAGATPTADTTPPSVAIAAPGNGATVSGTVAVNVNAADNVGVARVELRVNGVAVATDTASPFAFGWNSTQAANGAATLVAVAFDAAGNAASSAAVTVTVANNAPVVADTTPPAVAILNPLPGTSIAGNSFTVSASASDNAGAAGLTQSLYIDGALKATATGGALVYKWNTRRLATGVHVIAVVARDAAGNSATATVQVTR